MPLKLAPASEEDLPRIIDIQFAAFGEDWFNQILFPPPVAAETKTASVTRTRNEMTNSQNRIVKCIDTDADNEIIGYAKWHIYEQQRPESEWNVTPRREWGDGTNVEAADEFWDKLLEYRRRINGGRAHCLLGILTTDPPHQRRGAGAMLVQWGCEIADELGLECYLEASDAGYRLYKSKGFRDVGYLDMDMSKYDKTRGMHRHTCMIRPFKGKAEA